MSQCHFDYHTSYIDWPAIEPGSLRSKDGDYAA